MKQIILVCTSAMMIILSMAAVRAVRADIAPPETPPGSNLVPGSEFTHVRMAAETVIMTVSKDSADPKNAIARTDATFIMRNLGTETEEMKVRFPLTFFNGSSDGSGNFPEIQDIAIKINGRTVPYIRELQPYLASEESSYAERTEIPWAIFDVAFPPSVDVTIGVTYKVSGYGYYPYEAFKYILETGAGWNDTIGIVDVIVRFPYEISEKNVGVKDADYAGYGFPTPGGVISGKEVRWHFENLEPTQDENIQFLLVTPSLWESVLRETEIINQNPKDGEAWGRLGKAYKEIIRMSKGYLRDDPAGSEMFQLSRAAYEKCLGYLPQDPVWHFGYADLLWSYYYFNIHGARKNDSDGILPLILSHLQTALIIDANTQQARDLLTEISYSVPEAVQIVGDEFIFLGLTATPMPPTPWKAPTDTPFLSATTMELNIPTATQIPLSTIEPDKSGEIPVQSPICGSFVLTLPILIGIFVGFRSRRI